MMSPRLTGGAQALGTNDGAQVGHGIVEAIVDDHIVVFVVMRHLDDRLGRTLADGLVVVLTATPQPLAECVV